ncbi:dinuclear metal center YbgI/SA1388 family protein [Catalinimonas alkaloidigena]|uniref:Nif3-like dinuclear metal center hexameric protein n=1 Tax=Catalinimonas alkaloidigena TaxID=1075417 RepID=UPI002404D3B5|nr:Nif3-like dinuclear metal center hexameric protein [Catalinimonas alkaloidigena]MDF9794812.1 dinuclear metal center YbgI/SA1388 family protein [Catalinimonas alkaloidigena]
MSKIKEVIAHLESIAPRAYQESYDNAGLITGNRNDTIEGVMISLDATEAIVDEAIDKGCNLIIAHHPIVFRGLKSLTGRNYVERTVIKAIKNDIAIYAIHTNLDNVSQGVNKKICEKIGLQQTQTLLPKKQLLNKLTVFVPTEDSESLLNALSEAGAGHIGNYTNCSFQVEGTGTFQPNEQANPAIGERGKLEKVKEQRIEVIFPAPLTSQVLSAMRRAHPYEEVAYYLHALENENQEVGSGMIGKLPEAMPAEDYLDHLKQSMRLQCIRYTQAPARKIERVAVCGGAGSFLLPQAIHMQADAFVTADFKYHEFFDAEDHLMIADIGHYESEVYTKELIMELLSRKFVNFAVHLAKTNTNPIFYYK